MRRKNVWNKGNKRKTALYLTGALLAGVMSSNCFAVVSYADFWEATLHPATGTTGTQYSTSDIKSTKNKWLWLDDDKDGIHECYYFDDKFFLAKNTVVDGCQVNETGQWVVDGVVQTKQGAVTEEMNIQKFNNQFFVNAEDDYTTLDRTEILINRKIKEFFSGYPLVSGAVQVGRWYYVWLSVSPTDNLYDSSSDVYYLARVRSDGGAVESVYQFPENERPFALKFSNKGKLIFEYVTHIPAEDTGNPFTQNGGKNVYHYKSYDLTAGQWQDISESEYESLKLENSYGDAVFNTIDGKYYRYDNSSKTLKVLNIGGSVAEEKTLNIDMPEMNQSGSFNGRLHLEAANGDKLYFRFNTVRSSREKEETWEYQVIVDKNSGAVQRVYLTDEYAKALIY